MHGISAPDFSKLEIVVAAAARKRTALEKLLKVLSSKNFDKEDTESVVILLNSILEEQRNATCELKKRRQLYETTLKAAQIQIHERHEVYTLTHITYTHTHTHTHTHRRCIHSTTNAKLSISFQSWRHDLQSARRLCNRK
jgi:hypothetical protein